MRNPFFIVKMELGTKKHHKKMSTGALQGLIGKSGAKPARSRHCNAESALTMPLEKLPGRLGGR